MHLHKTFAALILLACSAATAWGSPQRPANPIHVNSESAAAEPNSRNLASVEEQPSFTPASLSKLPANLLRDQRDIWSSPARLRWRHADWLVPLGGLTGWLMFTDRQFSTHLSNDPRKLRKYRQGSDLGTGALGGTAAGLYFWGRRCTTTTDERPGCWLGKPR